MSYCSIDCQAMDQPYRKIFCKLTKDTEDNKDDIVLSADPMEKETRAIYFPPDPDAPPLISPKDLTVVPSYMSMDFGDEHT